jgi:hypothetical protein
MNARLPITFLCLLPMMANCTPNSISTPPNYSGAITHEDATKRWCLEQVQQEAEHQYRLYNGTGWALTILGIGGIGAATYIKEASDDDDNKRKAVGASGVLVGGIAALAGVYMFKRAAAFEGAHMKATAAQWRPYEGAGALPHEKRLNDCIDARVKMVEPKGDKDFTP